MAEGPEPFRRADRGRRDLITGPTAGEDGPGMGTVVLGGFVHRIAETITRAGTATS